MHHSHCCIAKRLKRETIDILVAACTGYLEFVIMEDILSCLAQFTSSKFEYTLINSGYFLT